MHSDELANLQDWFKHHVSLSGKPYTLDADQARAVVDQHKNTIVTARAGSGKTRVIVAKTAYLVGKIGLKLEEIIIFMFNRTAAAEVNQRIGEVRIDGKTLLELSGQSEIKIAFTFHKFALDLLKREGEQPQILSELEQQQLVCRSFQKAAAMSGKPIPKQERADLLKLTASFIARAGQKFIGPDGLGELKNAIELYAQDHLEEPAYQSKISLHYFFLLAYESYLSALRAQKIDFNLLMQRAAHLLKSRQTDDYAKLKYIMVDEYQDFSFLFLNLIRSLRAVCPEAHLFVVGDDWQAINRFAGSDVDYFVNFAEYFPEDCLNIPLVTNYRSDRAIVEHANDYMLTNYDSKTTRAIPFSHDKGKITHLNHEKVRFDKSDLREDALGDARFQLALAKALGMIPTTALKSLSPNLITELSGVSLVGAAKLLKTVFKIIQKHPREPLLLLHRHNFTSYPGVTLEKFFLALRQIVIDEKIMSAAQFDQQIRIMTMHKSKGLESDIVILLELNRDQVLSEHPHATLFEIFGDSRATEKADQHRLLYVALTRAKHRLYILSTDDRPAA